MINKENDISSSLDNNDLISREDALFNCLKVPNDDVKYAAVDCLFVVPLDELKANEISKICRIPSDQPNIGAGKTELILSVVYWICSNFVVQADDEEEPIDSKKVF